jgi:hypothetical protein
MFLLKLDMLFSSLKDAKKLAKRLNRHRHSDADPRELQRMRAELRAAREHMRQTNILNHNRIF